ncbi:MAG: hypothetical protein A2Y40_09985 [Candidatus Margulisbacteria bacterium GWF2_35_9]|nr:MAG: hypothetical protein A2Y40_09985 [Candidatus Margulisbacteria bacterium GWF2_35_9]
MSFTPRSTLPIGTSINIDFQYIKGSGTETTKYLNTVYCPMPSVSNPIKTGMGGISINIIDNSPDYIYTGSVELPVFEVKLRSYFTNSTLNTLSLLCNGDIQFSNTATNNYIHYIFLYADKNTNDVWDESTDEKILTISRGEFVFTDTNKIVITLNSQIAKYTKASNQYNFFIHYFTTQNIEEEKTILSQITAGSYTSLLYNRLHPLSGFSMPVSTIYTSQLGTLVVENYPTTAMNVFPQGSSDNIAYYINLRQTGNPSYNYIVWNSITIKNTGVVSDNHIFFSIYKDINKNKKLEITDPKIYSAQKNNSSTGIIRMFDIGDVIPASNSSNYFITLALSSTSNFGLNMASLRIEHAGYSGVRYGVWSTPDNAIISGDILSSNFSISAMKMGYTITNDIFFYNDNTNIPYICLNVKDYVENSNTLNIVTSIKSNKTSTLGYLAIYRDISPLQTLSVGDQFLSSTNINLLADTILACPTVGIGTSISHNFILVYRPYKYLTSGTSININIKRIYGSGYISRKKLEVYSNLPSKNILMAGIYANVQKNIQDSVFVGDMEVPVLKIGIKSYYAPATINRLILSNVSDIMFHLDNSNQNRVENVYVYKDSNSNKRWDAQDTRALNINRTGYKFLSIENEELILTLNTSFPTYNISTDESFYFVNYKLAPNVQASKSAIAKISDITYTDAVHLNNHSLRYPMEKIASTSFKTGDADIIFLTHNILVSTNVFQGESKSPVLSFQVRVINYIPSMSIIVSHNLPLLKGNDYGIKKITLVEDVDGDKKYSLGDILHDYQTSFNSLTTISMTMKELNKLSAYVYKFLLLYDFGADIPTSQFSNDVLKIALYKKVSTNDIKVSGLFPMPNPDTQLIITGNRVKLELISVSPSVINYGTNPEIHMVLKISNQLTNAISVTSIFPQFYKNSISSLNVSYQYNLFTSINIPINIGQFAAVTLEYIASPSLTFEATNLFVDGFLEYTFDSKIIQVHRKKLFSWESIATDDATAVINIPTYDVFFLEYPEYISKLEREAAGTTYNFRNGEILEYGNYLLIHFIRNGQEIDLFNTSIKLNGTELTAFTAPSNIRYDIDNGIIRLGPLQENDGAILVSPVDIANNPYPKATIKYYMNTNLFIHDFLVFPSKAIYGSLATTPMRIGFLLSKPANINLYLFNSIGQVIWNTQQTYNIYGYKEVPFDGKLTSGQTIPKGMYLLKLVASEIGKKVYEKTITKFIVY